MKPQKSKNPSSEVLFRRAERYEEQGNLHKAFRCLLAGAQQGDSGSQLNLANLYAAGRGVRKSLKNAEHWYQKAYRNGESTAALNLAIDKRNVGKTRSAIAWFKKAIAMKNGEAAVALAKMYKERKGGRKIAERLLREALSLERDYISETTKEEAKSLLKQT